MKWTYPSDRDCYAVGVVEERFGDDYDPAKISDKFVHTVNREMMKEGFPMFATAAEFWWAMRNYYGWTAERTFAILEKAEKARPVISLDIMREVRKRK